MPSLVGTTVAANYLKAENPFSRFGTPDLIFLKITGLTGVGTGATAADSLYQKALRGVAATAEIYFAHAQSADVLIVGIVSNTQTAGDTKPAGGGIDTGTGFGILEAAINASTAGTSTVAAATFA
jgi:hypothetical protein